jgi:hypothetical protein
VFKRCCRKRVPTESDQYNPLSSATCLFFSPCFVGGYLTGDWAFKPVAVCLAPNSTLTS